MKLKTIFIIRKILTPFIIIFFSGFIGVFKWNVFVRKLHHKAHKENKNNIWFTKKVIALYLKVVFTTLINIFSWIVLIYFLFN